MQLAADEIIAMVEGAGIHLRPTLRAAARLDRRHGGFDTIARALADGNVTILQDVIREGAGDHAAIASIMAPPLFPKLDQLCDQAIAFIFALCQADQVADKLQQETDQTQRITFAEYHAKLFRIATGWLGWTPEQAWGSTPAEIAEAYEGRVEMLKAIFGGASDREMVSEPDTTRDEAGWAELKALALMGGNRAG
jgi:hypothetical protein